MDNRPIGVFDSGLGGLTCVKEIMRTMPSENIIYFGDTGRVPYGTRGRETVIKYVRQDINFLKSFDIKLIIIACGTASSAALPIIENEFDTDVIGVLDPASMRAVMKSKNKKIGVIGTSGTIGSGKFAEKIKQLDQSAEVYAKACPMFVPFVENGYTHSEATRIIAEEYLVPLRESGIDTLILGCTHYPMLTDIIRDIMGDGVTLIDSGAAAAHYAYDKMNESGLLAEESRIGAVHYYVSDTVDNFEELAEIFLAKKVRGEVEKIDIEKY